MNGDDEKWNDDDKAYFKDAWDDDEQNTELPKADLSDEEIDDIFKQPLPEMNDEQLGDKLLGINPHRNPNYVYLEEFNRHRREINGLGRTTIDKVNRELAKMERDEARQRRLEKYLGLTDETANLPVASMDEPPTFPTKKCKRIVSNPSEWNYDENNDETE